MSSVGQRTEVGWTGARNMKSVSFSIHSAVPEHQHMITLSVLVVTGLDEITRPFTWVISRTIDTYLAPVPHKS